MTILIGIAGKARTGKDTAAEYIEKMYGYDRYAFALPIKNALHALGFYREIYDNDTQKERLIPGFDVSYRTLAQTLGTEWARSLHPNFWILIAQRELYASRDYGAAGFVISDVRFENEASWIRAEGGCVIHIDGPQRASLVGGSAGHSSEAGIKRELGDVIVTNLGTPQHLYNQLDTVVETFRKERTR